MRSRRLLASTAALALAGALAGAGATTAAYTDRAQAVTEPVPADVPLVVHPIRQANSLDTNAALSDGKLWLWGFFGDGANPGGGPLGARVAGTAVTNNVPTRFRALSDVVDVSANAYGYKALTSDGRLWTWGTDGYHENGTLGGTVTATWQPIATDVVATAGSEYANAWLRADGTVWTSGTATFGQRGTGSTSNTSQNAPTRVTFPTNDAIVYVGGAYEGFYAMDEAGRVYYWGRDYRGGAGNGDNGDAYRLTPTAVPALTALVAAEGGLAYLGGGYAWGALQTQAGNVYTWGSGEQNGNGHHPGSQYGDEDTPRLLLSDVTQLAVGFQSGKALKSDGTVWAWGYHLVGGAFRTTAGAVNSTNSLQRVYDGSAGRAIAVGGTKDTAAYTLADGTLWTWGENGAGAACGGRTYGQCATSVLPNGSPNGLYVWPPTKVEGIG